MQRAKLQVHLDATGSRGKILLDGMDISAVVRGIALVSAVGEVASVQLTLLADYEFLLDEAKLTIVRDIERPVEGMNRDDLVDVSHLGAGWSKTAVRKAD
jgi:hypothetical protein